MNRKYRFIPAPFRALLTRGAWLVGSGAEWYVSAGSGAMPKDLDIIVPPSDAGALTHLDQSRVRLNSFGGIKLRMRGVTADVWFHTLDDFTAASDKGGFAVRLKPFTLVKFEKGQQ